MKNFKKALQKGLLSCALVVSLILGISASPAFAAHGDSSSAESGMSNQQEPVAPDSDGQNGQNQPGEAGGLPDGSDEGGKGKEDEGEDSKNDDQDEDTDKSFNPIDSIAKLPEVIGDEFGAMFDNATDSDMASRANLPKKSYDKIWYGGKKTWKNADGTDANGPVDDNVNSVTVRIQGFVDWKDDGVIGADDKKTTLENYAAGGSFGAAKIKHNSKGCVDYDLNGDGKIDDKDRFFDANADGEIDSSEKVEWAMVDNCIVAPYQVYDEELAAYGWIGGWKYSTNNLERCFYEYEPVKDEEGNSLGTFTFKLGENGQPVKHEIIFSVTELPVEGYESARIPNGGEFSAKDFVNSENENLGKEACEDGFMYNKVVDFVNTPEISLEKTGQLIIEKTFKGPIYATSHEDGNGTVYNTQNAAIVVFHIQGVMPGTDRVVYDSQRSLSFNGDSDETQQIVMDKLPVGAEYTVTELAYGNDGFEPVGESVQKFTLEAPQGQEGEDVAESESPAGSENGSVENSDEGAQEDATALDDDGESPGEGADNNENGNDDEFVPTVSITVTFENKGARAETPNQGWINEYSPSGSVYEIKQISRVVRLIR